MFVLNVWPSLYRFLALIKPSTWCRNEGEGEKEMLKERLVTFAIPRPKVRMQETTWHTAR